jgi:hypothetical protein
MTFSLRSLSAATFVFTLHAAFGCGSEEGPGTSGPGPIGPVVIGQPNPSSNEGLRTGLSLPNDALISGSRLLVVDQNNSRVLVWNALPTRDHQQADLVLGQPDFTTSVPHYGGFGDRGFRGSNGVASDGTRLIVADRFNFRVLIWNTFPTENFQPADVVLGQPDFDTTTSNTGGISARSMTEPWVWLGGGKLFVADRNNFRVLIWNSIPTENHAPADVVLGQPDMTSAVQNNGGLSASSIWDPGRGWVDGTRLYVPDLANHRVLVWNEIPTANNTPADSVLGQTTLSTNGPNAGNAAVNANGFNGPIAVWAAGNTVAVADYTNHRVLVWTSPLTSNGQAADLVLGQQSFTTNTENSGGLSASSLNTPNAIAGDDERLVVVDRFNNRVLFYSPLPATNGAPASLVLGQPDMVSGRFNNAGPVTAVNFVAPQALSTAGDGFALADSGNARVLLWNTPPTAAGDGAYLVLGQPDFGSVDPVGDTSTTARTLCGPQSVHSDGTRLAVGEQCGRRIAIWNAIPRATQQPADLAVGQPDLTSAIVNNGGIGASSLAGRPQPHFDGQRLFVADPNNHRVLIFDSIPTSSGSAADVVLGQPDMTSAVGKDGGTSARSLAQPMFVYTSGGKVFVADSQNHRVLVWNAIPTSNQEPADLVLGQPDMDTGSESPASGRTLNSPRGVHVDASGRLYVVDAGNHRILYFDAVPTQNHATADGVIGQPDLSSGLANNGGLSAQRLQSPGGLFSIGDRVYIADSGNDRLVILPRP